MEFKLLTKLEKTAYSNAILEILTESDQDFVPPLSSRSSTTQNDLSNNACSNCNGIEKYCNELLTQSILGAIEDNQLIGFVSFKINLTNEVITDSYLPNIYISTLALKRLARGKHLTYKMYDYLFSTLYKDAYIFTRTWSTNLAHTKILSKFDFAEFFRKPNDRGQNIDTVYYLKSITK